MKSNSHSLRVALIWNGVVFQEKSFGEKNETVITVGDSDRNVFTVMDSGMPSDFPMFERTDSGYKLRFTDKLKGRVTIGGKEQDLKALISSNAAKKQSSDAYEVQLQRDDWGLIEANGTSFYFQVTQPVAGAAVFGVGSFEGPLVTSLAFSMIIHVAFLIYASLYYNPNADLENIMNFDRFAKFMVDDVKDPIVEEEVEVPEEDTTGKKAGGEEGKFGDEDSDIPDSKIPKTDGEMVDKIDVKNIGINKALSSDLLGAGPLKNIFGQSDGFDAKMNVAMSGEGGDLVVGRGAGGMGMRGTGGGGGGEGFGRVGGLGKVDTGGGKGTGAKIGKAAAKKVSSKLSQGTPQVGDFCDAANIRRVVGGRSNAIRACFERELQTNPSLSGQITAQWRIGLDGSVDNAMVANTTMNNREVEGCIVRVIQRMRFEKPDGGICVINYPFVFSGLE